MIGPREQTEFDSFEILFFARPIGLFSKFSTRPSSTYRAQDAAIDVDSEAYSCIVGGGTGISGACGLPLA